MKKSDIIRAWKDPQYRARLSAAEQAQLPQHPAGLIELDDADLAEANGRIGPTTCPDPSICPNYTQDGFD